MTTEELEARKMEFVAGLQLQQRPDQTPIENTPLTKLELSYLEKCKLFAQMIEINVCACHNDKYAAVKSKYIIEFICKMPFLCLCMESRKTFLLGMALIFQRYLAYYEFLIKSNFGYSFVN